MRHLFRKFSVSLWILGALQATAAVTTTVVDIPVVDATQRVLYIKPDAPIANIISVPGGSGILGIQNDGSMTTIEGACSPIGRVRQGLAEQGIAIALVDANSKGETYNPDNIVEVSRYMRARHNVPTWIVGGSAATAVATALAATRASEFPGGVVIFSPDRPSSLVRTIMTPALVISHALDTQQFTSLMFGALTAAPVRERVILSGGTNGGCGYHLFNGVEAAFQAAVAEFVIRNSAASSGPLNYSDMWWAGEAENGWGMSIQQHGQIQLNALYVYDSAGKPIWYVLPGGMWNSNFTTYSGAIYQPTSAPLNNYSASQFLVGAPVGNISINFTSNATATLQYVINGISGQKSIQRQIFGRGTSPIQVGDMWWGGTAQDGWGISITQQAGILFGAWYTYAPDGKATWYVMTDGTWSGNTYTGAFFSTLGSPWLGTTYNPNQLKVVPAGTLTLNFSDANNAMMTYAFTAGPFAGTTQTKPIVRQPY